MATIPVIVQTAEAEALPFVEWDVDKLDDVFALLREWGLVEGGEDRDLAAACGEFVVHKNRVVFRVSVVEYD